MDMDNIYLVTDIPGYSPQNHVYEDEINHRGQIRIIRKKLSSLNKADKP